MLVLSFVRKLGNGFQSDKEQRYAETGLEEVMAQAISGETGCNAVFVISAVTTDVVFNFFMLFNQSKYHDFLLQKLQRVIKVSKLSF